ncbi:MAG TPA: hypothetical protein VF897_13725, partial [Roseiflexaceae bacterium]
TIALAIGLCEGTVDDLAGGADDLVQAGYAPAAAATAAGALTRYAAAHVPAPRLASGLLPASADLGADGRL